MKVYAKDSFERFGDDLTELIVSYLWFEDKVRLECVSKQWRRYVYQKQFVLCIDKEESKHCLRGLVNKSSYNYTKTREVLLESVLKKCHYIRKISTNFQTRNNVLSLIGQYCPNIKSLAFRNYKGKEVELVREYGHKLEELILYDMTRGIENIVEFCPNVKNILIINDSVLFNPNKEFLPKLEHFMKIVYIYAKDVEKLKILSNKYRQTMKTLNVRLTGLTEEQLKTCIECIARFVNLNELILDIKPMNITEEVVDCLSLIGQKCTKLSKLKLRIDRSVPISDHFFDAFTEFKAIRKLNIFLSHKTVLSGSVECFRNCQQLNDLNICYERLREDFFANIGSFVPKLQYLQIKTFEQFSNSFIDSFHSMESIQKVVLSVYDMPNVDFYKMNWYFRKCLSEVMASPMSMDIIPVNDNCGLHI